jgi:superfamily II DNA or RNA helicase
MMTPVRQLTGLRLGQGYSSSRNNLLEEFYVPCLNVASEYDRAVGYFSSTLYIAAGIAFSDFAIRGGRVRLVCSPSLTTNDIEAIARGYEMRRVLTESLLADIRSIIGNARSRPIAEFVATLIAVGALEVKLAFRPNARGIFHDKLGIFRDGERNGISFVGSANETFSAWDPNVNHESFEVFQSWLGKFHSERIDRHMAEFAELWGGDVPGIWTRSFPDVALEQLLAVANPVGIDDAAQHVRQLVGDATFEGRDGARVFPSQTVMEPESPSQEERRPLQEHQLAVIRSWKESQQRGIIDHVTGAGKTITALSIMREWMGANKPAIVLVPSELLVSQWITEVNRELRDLNPALLQVGAGNGRDRWAPLVADFTRNSDALGARVVIATLASAATDAFITRVQQGSHLLVVADEVHRTGAAGFRRVLGLHAGGVLGLSATPQRYGDPTGTDAILSYFGVVLQPPFGIDDAIKAGRLVPYDYYIHRCELTEQEQVAWDNLSNELSREYARLPRDAFGRREHTNRFRQLLFRRAAIVKQAQNKVPIAFDVIRRSFHEGDRWLAYCDSQVQLGNLLGALRSVDLPVYEFHSNMVSARNETLDYFVRRGGIIVAIRCLDEGIDIPLVDRAIILASSANSREFVQRRGRVLRWAKGKYSARVHDLLVVPSPSGGLREDDSPRSLIRAELRRAAEFARFARNTAVSRELEFLAREQGLDEIDQMSDVEEDDADA